MTGRAAVVSAANQVAVEPIEVPRVLGPHDALVETEATFISTGTELANFTGTDPGVHRPGSWNAFPARPGYANCGRIVRLGSEVHDRAVGERVFSMGPHASHHVLALDDPTVLAVRAPDEIPSDLAAAVRMGLVSITSLHVADLALNDWVAVFGLGLVGNLAAQMFALAGARVVGVDPLPARRALARRVGIERVVGGDPAEVLAQLRELTGGGVQIAVEAVGHAAVAAQAIQAVRPRGELILLGSPRVTFEADLYEFLRPVHYTWVTIKGALEHRVPRNPTPGVRHTIADNAATVLDMVTAGRLHLAELISHRLPAADIARAYHGLLNDPEHYWGVALDWREP